jgi:hypothetical protein
VLGWLTRLFGKRPAAESAEAAPLATVAAPAPVRSESAASTPVAEGQEALPPAAIAGPLERAPTVAEAREVCPTCGKTSVFAGPPGHRYCMHCALRQELFDASAAAHQ